MRSLPSIEQSGRIRTRRWDAVVLGGALPGLVAAIRLGMNGARVLLLEEAAAVDAFPGIREPFLITGAKSDSVLGRCLRELGIPLIDRQRIGSDPLAYQVAFPDARVDIGEPGRTLEELVSWKFAEPESAKSLLRELAGAAAAERDAMLAAPVVRVSRRRTGANPRRTRELEIR
jgi:choline dehydrogenase-like flavoprotein